MIPPRPFDQLDHRLYPPPSVPWVMHMRWHQLAFLHWRVSAEALGRHLPPGLALDTYDGSAWLGVVPFTMTSVRPRFCPPIPGISAFPELNLRTYVTAGGRRGVWFFSLDAACPLAVRAARFAWFLPYYEAAIELCERDGWVDYSCRRTHHGAPPAEFIARYRASGSVCTARAGTLEHWLTERYCLYASDRRGRVYRGEIQHVPWPLQPAEVELQSCDLTGSLGMTLDGPPLAHFAHYLDVAVWWRRPVPASELVQSNSP